jgi:hypothetical protein
MVPFKKMRWRKEILNIVKGVAVGGRGNLVTESEYKNENLQFKVFCDEDTMHKYIMTDFECDTYEKELRIARKEENAGGDK